jgi:DNA repair exonuclease SbcCD ATPase subunit
MALDESLRSLADKCSEKSSLCVAQEEEIARLQVQFQEKERQTDLLLELMQSADNCSNQEVRELCRRVEEAQKQAGVQREEMKREQSTRRAKEDKMLAEISLLEGKLKKASRAHQELQQANEVLQRTTQALAEREAECRTLRMQQQQLPHSSGSAHPVAATAVGGARGVGGEATSDEKEVRARVQELLAENAKLKVRGCPVPWCVCACGERVRKIERAQMLRSVGVLCCACVWVSGCERLRERARDRERGVRERERKSE